MTLEAIPYVIAAGGTLLGLLGVLSALLAQRQAYAERRELYSRLQSGTLHDYAAHWQAVEEHTQRVAPELPTSEPDAFVEHTAEVPHSYVIQTQAGFDRLMGGQE